MDWGAAYSRHKSANKADPSALTVTARAPPSMADHSRLERRGDNAGISNPNDSNPIGKPLALRKPVINSDINLYKPATINRNIDMTTNNSQDAGILRTMAIERRYHGPQKIAWGLYLSILTG